MLKLTLIRHKTFRTYSNSIPESLNYILTLSFTLSPVPLFGPEAMECSARTLCVNKTKPN